jgi:hypothetical protein
LNNPNPEYLKINVLAILQAQVPSLIKETRPADQNPRKFIGKNPRKFITKPQNESRRQTENQPAAVRVQEQINPRKFITHSDTNEEILGVLSFVFWTLTLIPLLGIPESPTKSNHATQPPNPTKP